MEKVYGKNKRVTTVAEYVFDETNKMVLGYNALREISEYTYNGLGALVTNTWVIAKNGYGYHDVSAIANGEELLDPDEVLNTPTLEPELPGADSEPVVEPETPDTTDEPTATTTESESGKPVLYRWVERHF